MPGALRMIQRRRYPTVHDVVKANLRCIHCLRYVHHCGLCQPTGLAENVQAGLHTILVDPSTRVSKTWTSQLIMYMACPPHRPG